MNAILGRMSGADVGTVITAAYGAVVATFALVMEIKSRRALRRPSVSVRVSTRRSQLGAWDVIVDVVNRGPRDVRLVLIRVDQRGERRHRFVERNLAEGDVPRLGPSDTMRFGFPETELSACGFDLEHHRVSAHARLATGEEFESVDADVGHDRALLEADFLRQSAPRVWRTAAVDVMRDRPSWERDQISLTVRRLQLGRHVMAGGLLLAGSVPREEIAAAIATVKSLQLATGELTFEQITERFDEEREDT